MKYLYNCIITYYSIVVAQERFLGNYAISERLTKPNYLSTCNLKISSLESRYVTTSRAACIYEGSSERDGVQEQHFLLLISSTS
jgi:hypothetical protein